MTNYRRRKRPYKPAVPQFKLNANIKHPEVRVIDEEGFVGIMTMAEAMKLANERDADLVEINPKATPPIVKMMDYNKFKYQQSKSDAKKAKPTKNKTIRVSVRIGPHDLSVQGRKCDEFLEKEYPVKLQVQMKGREKSHPEVAEEVMGQFVVMITKPYDFIQEPKLIGDSVYATIKPKA